MLPWHRMNSGRIGRGFDVFSLIMQAFVFINVTMIIFRTHHQLGAKKALMISCKMTIMMHVFWNYIIKHYWIELNELNWLPNSITAIGLIHEQPSTSLQRVKSNNFQQLLTDSILNINPLLLAYYKRHWCFLHFRHVCYQDDYYLINDRLSVAWAEPIYGHTHIPPLARVIF